MDKATPTPSPASADSVMAKAMMLVGALDDSCEEATSLPFLEAVTALRAEVERLAAQAAPSEAQADLVIAVHALASHFENTLYALRDDAEAVTKAKGDIAHALQISAKYNRNGAAAQPSQAPVVQAGEYPPEPWPEDFAGWLEVRSDDEIKAEFRAYVDADRASRAPAARMLTREEIAECCNGLMRDNSAIETWIRRSVEKAFAVNGLLMRADGKIGGVL